MDKHLRLKFKIGEIEFEAEGNPEDVERQREVFSSSLLPLAVQAMMQTKSLEGNYIDNPVVQELSLEEKGNAENLDKLQRMSINEFLKLKGFVSQIDIAIGLIYYFEIVKNIDSFGSEDLKGYFSDAKIPVPSNPSDVINKLIGKTYIMGAEEKGKYKLTISGEEYIEKFVPKESKQRKSSPKSNRRGQKQETIYKDLNADDLHLNQYPEIKKLDSLKKQMILTLYIVSEEGIGEAFATVDVQHIMTDVLGLPATKDQVNGVFTREKTWFADVTNEENKKIVRHRLLVGAKDFAKEIIDNQEK